VKQVLFRDGKATVEEVPAPRLESGQVLVQVAYSCVSPGTELATAAATSVLGSLCHNPWRLRKAFDIARDHGFRSLCALARERLSFSSSSGYSCSGVVLEAGSGLEGFREGDKVACAGAGYANHAEVVVVPQNLVTKVPECVDLADAATVALGAIALQGVRRAQPSVGERIGVIGLGILGQLTVQILKAAGCLVFGWDPEPDRVARAKSFGLDAAPEDHHQLMGAAQRFTEGYGLDAVLLTAASKSDEPVHQAMQIARRKARVVVVGDVGLSIRRASMYAKELDLLISTSYGAGRYDPSYEEEGLDYPYAYVRWTENRNMQAYLQLIASGRVTPAPLITRRLPISDAAEAYYALKEDNPRPYTVLLKYPPTNSESSGVRKLSLRPRTPVKNGTIRLAIVGAGSFARTVHIPNLRDLTDRFQIEAIVTNRGANALAMVRQIGARTAATDYKEILADSTVDAVLIATRHHLHTKMVEDALRAGKHVFVEKPLALTEEALQNLNTVVGEVDTLSSRCPVVFVGFNRRYSPYVVRLRELVAERSTPLHLSYRVNAGYLPPTHWVHGAEGGGRLLGEACHFVDLFRFLVGAPAVEVHALGLRATGADLSPTGNFTSTIRYADGSICTLLYTSQGAPELPKEVLELHMGARSFLLDDYRALRGFGAKLDLRTRTQQKGYREEIIAFHDAISGVLDTRALWKQAVEVTRTSLEMNRQVRSR
jgi:predicted dehydrogenase/threonine dehydrogenase-like Zn-dependent dehydrogenase